MSSSHIKSVSVRITGRVQGVWFRGWTRQTAVSLQLDGWVRNRRDGTVEAVFSGPAGAVDDMLRRCHAGPPGAHVTAIEKQPADTPQTGFRVRTSR